MRDGLLQHESLQGIDSFQDECVDLFLFLLCLQSLQTTVHFYPCVGNWDLNWTHSSSHSSLSHLNVHVKNLHWCVKHFQVWIEQWLVSTGACVESPIAFQVLAFLPTEVQVWVLLIQALGMFGNAFEGWGCWIVIVIV